MTITTNATRIIETTTAIIIEVAAEPFLDAGSVVSCWMSVSVVATVDDAVNAEVTVNE